LERRGSLRPILPYELLGVIEHVENVNFFRDFNSENNGSDLIIWVQFEVCEQISCSIVKMHVKFTKLLSAALLKGYSQRPNTAKNCKISQYLLNLFGNL
jgi:hypothetical protein